METTDFTQVGRSLTPSSPVPIVCVPERMYLAMAHCYFGNGPRFGNPPEESPSKELPPSEEEVGKLPPISGPVTISRPLPGVPRGAATRDFKR